MNEIRNRMEQGPRMTMEMDVLGLQRRQTEAQRNAAPPQQEKEGSDMGNKDECVIKIIDEKPSRFGRHMKRGLEQIDFYNRLWMQDEAERDRLAKLADEARQAPRMPY
jgi:hypothetical protein